MKRVDQVFGWLLLLGGVGHTLGTLLWAKPMSDVWLWSLGASLAVFVLAALNLLRAGRPADRAVAWIAALGTAVWAVLALLFGLSIHNLLDPRALLHLVTSVVLVGFSIRTIRNAPGALLADQTGSTAFPH